MARYLSVIITFVTLLACQHQAEPSSIKDEGAPIETLIVLSGGFSSCPTVGVLGNTMRAAKTEEMYELLWDRDIPDRIRRTTGNAPAIFATCYTGPDNLVATFTEAVEGRFAWNQKTLQKERAGVTSFNVIQGEHLRSISFLSHIKSELQTYVAEKEQQGKQVQMYFIGHSYGGFTAIQLASHFVTHLKGIATLDPISMLDCQAKDMATKPLSTLAGRHEGCLRFPQDSFSERAITNIDRQMAASPQEIWWHNIYQTQFRWLHSGELNAARNGAVKNDHLGRRDFRGAILGGDYHSQVGRTERVWEIITSYF